ncbi:MAG: SIS domain-containing protein [Gammaproteobacteria bacterium]
MNLSLMEKEALEAPHMLAKQFTANRPRLDELTTRLRTVKPIAAMTIARGSSDHAAMFAKYLLEIRAGIMTASAAPSVFTLYQRTLAVENCLVIGISQSGASPDIAEMMAAMRKAGAITVAFVNETNSELALAAEYCIPLHAGTEHAVAATKTYIATLGALIQFVALMTQDNELLNAITQLPDFLQQATQKDWSRAITEYLKVNNTYIIGRGFSFPTAAEAALKFKETANIHAEAFSGAELLHGPFALVAEHFPILFFAQEDESFSGMYDLMKCVGAMGARAMVAMPMRYHDLHEEPGLIQLPMPRSLHPVCDPLLIIQAFYCMVARLTLARGLNPDEPKNLTKVTKTW